MAFGMFPVCHWSGADAARFEAGNGFLHRATDLIGNADSKRWLWSVWFEPADSAGGIYQTRDTTSGPPDSRVTLDRATIAGIMIAQARRPDGSIILFMRTSPIAANSGWHHWMGSVDMADPAKRHMFIDGVADISIVDQYDDDTILFAQSDHFIGALNRAGLTPWIGCLAHVYLFPGVSMDLSIVANQRKFIRADGTPADLLADGSGPTGGPPLVYVRGNAASIVINHGTGGDLPAFSGPIFDCATAP